MIHIQTPVIKRIILCIILLSFLACSNSKEQNALFKDTYIDVLSKEIFKFRHSRPPNPEEFERGIKGPLPSVLDTLNPLRLYVQKKHLEVALNKFNVKLPKEFKFVYDKTNKTVGYLPENIEKYSTKEYEFIEFNNLDEVFKNDKISKLNFGGTLQFSRVLLNKEYNRALFFARDTRDSLDSVGRLILLEKVNGKWNVLKSIVISIT